MSNIVQVFLDGSPVPADQIDGSQGSKISYDMNSEDGLLAVSYANSLTFSGGAYAYIISALVDSPTANANSIKLTIFATCCKEQDGSPLRIFSGLISRQDIAFCEGSIEGCSVEVSSLDNSATAEKINCIRNTIIHARTNPNTGVISDGEDESRDARFIGYYDEVRPYSNAYTGLFLVFYLIVLSTGVLLLITAVSLIVSLLSLGGVRPISLNDTRQALAGLVLKKRFHKAPFVSSYLQNACTLCGLALRSPLFQTGGEYHNLMRLDAPYAEGGKTPLEAQGAWLNFNRPNITFAQFFATFKELNLLYAVTDTELIFDRADRLQNNIWIDFSADQREILEFCFEPSDTVQPAGEIFKFADDGSDKIGNESNRLWSGNAVDYNTPFNPILSGIRQTTMQYGSARFVSDGGESATADITDTLIYGLASVGTSLVEKDLLLMSTGTASTPKLLMWDGFSGRFDGKVLRQRLASGVYGYSIPSWLNQNTQGSFGVRGFYDNLLFISDPRRSIKKNFAYTLRFTYLCQDLRDIGYGKYVKLLINGNVIDGSIDTVEVDLFKGEMTITGKI
jgi:hypothetical protein